MWFSSGGERVRETLDTAFVWSDQCSLVSNAPTAGQRGDAFWAQVTRHAGQIRAAIFPTLDMADPEVLRPLRAAGCVRRFINGAHFLGHFIWFERGEELRLLVAPDALRASTVAGTGLWMYWEGAKSALPDGLQAILGECWATSLPVNPEDTSSEIGSETPEAAYSRPIPSVREVLGIRSTRDLFDLDTEDQERALWSALIGEGAVDLEQAIRLCAERLRAQGFLAYQVLRQDGRVHAAIEERLLAARRRTDLFDRPRNGFVRAIQPDIDQLTAEQWRDCVMGALDEGAHVDRDQAVRLGFDHAQTVYGVSAQRLRVGGRADQALRSAINSSIRQGYLARDGAAYLIRVSALAPPKLRGVLDSAQQEEPAPRDLQVEPDRIEPTQTEPLPAPLLAETRLVTPPLAQVPQEPTPAAPSPGESPSPSAPSPIDRELIALDLPTRARNWAERHGVQTVLQLVAWEPGAFALERNVGRRTVRETRELIEAHLGYSWEQAHAAVRSGAQPVPNHSRDTDEEESIDAATEELTAGGPGGWAQVAASLTDEQRSIPLLDVRLPARMKTYARAEGLEVLGDLFRFSYASLKGRENLGRKSLNDTVDAVRDCLSERELPPVHATFLQAWQAQVSALEPIPRMIVTRRAGMHGSRETLEELGGMLGVSRERVRQIEAAVVERLRERSRWRRSVQENVTSAFGAGRAVPLDLLAQDPWWLGIERQELLLDYVIRRIFEDELFLLEAPSGKRYLTKFRSDEFVEHLESAKSRVAKLEYPIETSAIEEILHSEADPLDPVLFVEFEQAVGELLHLSADRPGVALGYGRYRDDEVLAFLSGQEKPVPIALIEERCGRGRLPDEVLYFKRGLVGLKRHFPDFDGWMERLVPAALDLMKERAAGRQWLVPEIHEVLRERNLIPDWLGHWPLASLLRLSEKVDYLGRLRVASKDSGHERLQYEELLENLLEEAGAPLDFDLLLGRARLQTDMSEGTATLMIREAPFVRLDESRVGLVERDIPGGPQAVAAAIEAVVQCLNQTERGLTPHQATVLVNELSDVHRAWTRQLVTSVLRNEASVRIDRSKNIGLDEWDDVRCPTRPEFMRRELQKAGGSLPIHDLSASMENFYGRAPDRGSLSVLAQQVGLTISGDDITRPATVIPEAPPSGVGINLTGIPTELREMFEELVQAPLGEVLELRTQVKQHVEAIENEHHVNEFVDLQGAHVLGRQCQRLLDRWDSLPIRDRHLACAAVRYFVSWHDIEHDLDIGGLDDDKQIMSAVLSHLGLQEEIDGALPS